MTKRIKKNEKGEKTCINEKFFVPLSPKCVIFITFSL